MALESTSHPYGWWPPWGSPSPGYPGTPIFRDTSKLMGIDATLLPVANEVTAEGKMLDQNFRNPIFPAATQAYRLKKTRNKE